MILSLLKIAILILSFLKIAIYIFVLISPLVLIDILSGWTFFIYPFYISIRLDLENIYLKDLMENGTEPPDGWHDTEYFSDIAKGWIVISQSISALIFFIIFAFNDGAGAFSTFIIGSIILAIIIKFFKYCKVFIEKYSDFLEWVYSIYKKIE